MTITLVNIDGDPDEPAFPAQRIDTRRWNGWARPWFDLDTVFSIVTMLTEDSPDYLVMLDGDTVVLAQDLGGGEWYTDAYEPEAGLYQFAAGTWRWAEVPEDEETAEAKRLGYVSVDTYRSSMLHPRNCTL